MIAFEKRGREGEALIIRFGGMCPCELVVEPIGSVDIQEFWGDYLAVVSVNGKRSVEGMVDAGPRGRQRNIEGYRGLFVFVGVDIVEDDLCGDGKWDRLGRQWGSGER